MFRLLGIKLRVSDGVVKRSYKAIFLDDISRIEDAISGSVLRYIFLFLLEAECLLIEVIDTYRTR